MSTSTAAATAASPTFAAADASIQRGVFEGDEGKHAVVASLEVEEGLINDSNLSPARKNDLSIYFSSQIKRTNIPVSEPPKKQMRFAKGKTATNQDKCKEPHEPTSLCILRRKRKRSSLGRSP